MIHDVPLPMTATTVDAVAARAGLVIPDDLLVVLDEDRELEGRGIFGHAWPDGDRITLYPDAFQDEEQLLRTIVHELAHVRQARTQGIARSSLESVEREREAYAEEERWWQSHLEKR